MVKYKKVLAFTIIAILIFVIDFTNGGPHGQKPLNKIERKSGINDATTEKPVDIDWTVIIGIQ